MFYYVPPVMGPLFLFPQEHGIIVMRAMSKGEGHTCASEHCAL